jgi:hypothetical protein
MRGRQEVMMLGGRNYDERINAFLDAICRAISSWDAGCWFAVVAPYYRSCCMYADSRES